VKVVAVYCKRKDIKMTDQATNPGEPLMPSVRKAMNSDDVIKREIEAMTQESQFEAEINDGRAVRGFHKTNESITIRVGTPLLRPGLTIETTVSKRYAQNALEDIMKIVRESNSGANS
jgi:hypothetical protein